MGVTVRRIVPSDADRLREIRLRSLAADPLSFGSTREREAAWDESTWAAWASGDATGDEMITLLAFDGLTPVGIAGAFREEGEPGTYKVVAMWVEPEARRRGIARALLRALESWVRSVAGSELLLYVTDASGSARALYESEGFAPDGTVTESAHTLGLMQTRMRKRVPEGPTQRG